MNMGGKWYGSTLKEALADLRKDWKEIKSYDTKY